MKKTITICVCVFVLFGTIKAKESADSTQIKNLQKVLTEAYESQKYELGGAYIDSVLSLKILKPEDEIYFRIHYSSIYKALFDYNNCLIQLNIADTINNTQLNNADYNLNIKIQKIFAYFDIQEYDKSYGLMREILPIIDSIHIAPQSLIYMQLGYIYFLKKEYTKSDTFYKKAVAISAEENYCNLPLMHSKQMELCAAQNQWDKVKQLKEKSLKISKECNVLKYELLTWEVQKKIALKYQLFEEYMYADSLYEYINKQYDAKNRQAQLIQIQADNALRVKQLEIEAVEKREKIILIASVIGIILLLLLSFLLFLLFQNRQKLSKNEQRLKKLDKLNKQIFSTISHDFKEPIINFNILLNKLNKNRESLDQEFIDDIKSNIESASNMLNNLLNWAKDELLQRKANLKAIDLYAVSQKSIENVGKNAVDKEIEIVNHIKQNASLVADKLSLQIALRNILSNAIKYSPIGSRIDIFYEKNCIKVVDVGIGISEDLKNKLLKEKVEPSYGTSGEIGFGLGLLLTQNLLQKSQFGIHFENNKPTGTICIIRPLKK